ncbi:MAG: TonB-dependent receptor [Halieaceae bacterium]|nr:TonB-dependent receptor [Halieaceae bacterium]
MKSFNKSYLSHAVAAAVASTLPGFAFAQDDEATEIEEIVVTGSRLTKSNVTSSVPLVQIGAEEINSRGVARVEDVVNILPNVFVSQTAEVANGANGTSTLNLRGLGSTRTLVLIDGKRLPFGSPFSSSANVDMVPARMVERVDIVTSGASAVYGSDAVAGVVNFITKRDFEGFEFDYQYSTNYNENSNGYMQNLLADADFFDPGATTAGEASLMSVLMGVNSEDGRGNITLFGTYEDMESMIGKDRDTGACTLFGSSNPFCGGSSNFRRFNGTVNNGVAGTVFQELDGTIVPIDFSRSDVFYNYGAVNHYQRPVERWNLGASGHYEITESVEAYFDTTYMNNKTAAQIAESASFNRPFQTNCSNPLLAGGAGPSGTGITLGSITGAHGSIDEVDGSNVFTPAAVLRDDDNNVLNFVSCDEFVAAGLDRDVQFINSHRNVEGGPRVSTYENSTWRAIFGLRGDINDDFAFDIFAQYAATEGTRISQNDLNFNRVQQSLYVTGTFDNPVCRDTSGGCVPWNIFTRNADGSTAVTDEAAAFIAGVGIVTGDTEQTVFGGTIEGDLTNFGIKSPMADAGMTGLVGFEYREDFLGRLTDDISKVSGGRGLTGTGGATLPIAGQIEVEEVFMEMSMPLITGQPMIQELGLTAGYRYSDYTTTGNGVSNTFDADTYFAGLSWAPNDDIRFRLNQSVAIRAPNVFDLYVGINTGLVELAPVGDIGDGDQCAGADPVATQAQCANTGLSAAQYGTVDPSAAGQFNLITGGNPNLVAERGETTTFGVVITPSMIENLSIAIDYFDIEVTDAIGTVPAQTSYDRCLTTGDPAFCQNIIRDTAGTLHLLNEAPGGGLAGISTQNVNVSNDVTEGVDVNITYSYDMSDMGSLNFDYAATFLDTKYRIAIPGDDKVECQDAYAGPCGLPAPEYNHRFLATWVTPYDLTVSATWRHIGETTLYGLTDPQGYLEDKMEERNYLDLAATYDYSENVQVRLGANNLLGDDAPVTTAAGTGTGNNNTYPGLFDVSTYLFAGVTVKF